MEGSVPLATELCCPNPKALSRPDKEAVALTHKASASFSQWAIKL